MNSYTGTHSRFDRSKYKTADRRMLGPKFDEYSPHLPTKSDLEKLPLEYRSLVSVRMRVSCHVLELARNSYASCGVKQLQHFLYGSQAAPSILTMQDNAWYRKMLAMKSKECPGIRKNYMDELLRRGTATRDKDRASTWDSVQ
jgi:hypothetical protein